MGFFRLLLLFRILQIDLRIRLKLKAGILTACAPVCLREIARKIRYLTQKHTGFSPFAVKMRRFHPMPGEISPQAEKS